MNSPQLTLDTGPALTRLRSLTSIQAVDLTGVPTKRAIWRRWRSFSDGVAREATTSLATGWPSPMGYWLAPLVAPHVAATQGARVLQVCAPGEDAAVDALLQPTPTPGGLGRPSQTIRLKGPDGELVLTIGGSTARVVASDATWDAMSEPVLLAACVYWRFQAIDAEIDRLTVEAENDLAHATMAVPSSLWNRKRLLGHARAVRAVMIDLPHFEGPLTDPYPYLSSDRAVQTFRTLAEKLHLEEWGESIDDRAEAVEDIYASVTEKLNEFRNFAVGSILEVTIIVILLAELMIRTYDTLLP